MFMKWDCSDVVACAYTAPSSSCAEGRVGGAMVCVLETAAGE